MSRWMFFGLLSLLLTVQVGVLPIVFSHGPVPNLLLAGIIWMLFQLRLERSLSAAVIGGGIVDIFSGLPMGSHIVSLVGTTMLVYALLAVFVPKEKTLLVLSGSVVLAYAAHQVLLLVVSWFFEQVGRGFNLEIGRFIQTSSLLTVAIMLVGVYGLELVGRARRRSNYEQKPF